MKYLLPTQGIRCMSEKKVLEIIEAMKNGAELPPIQVTKMQGNEYIIDGHHRYLAYIALGNNIEKQYINAKYIEPTDVYDWLDSIEYFNKKGEFLR